MWKLQRLSDGKLVVLKISGRIEAAGLSELKEVCASESDAEHVVLDLSELDLVGQEAVAFFAGCEERGATLRNCPPYIRDWITRERNSGKSR